MCQIRARHPTVALATKTDKNGQSTNGTKAKQVRDCLNEKVAKIQKSVYLKIVSQYSRSKNLK